MKRWKITTRTGSVYYVTEHENGTWTLSGNNVGTAQSSQLSLEKEWLIEKPTHWPPTVDQTMLFVSAYFYHFDSPDRIPGGGKYTSTVVRVEEDVV